jgi:hypothetical protein
MARGNENDDGSGRGVRLYGESRFDRLQLYFHDHLHSSVASTIGSVVVTAAGVSLEVATSNIWAHIIGGELIGLGLGLAMVAGKTYQELQEDNGAVRRPGPSHLPPPPK